MSFSRSGQFLTRCVPSCIRTAPAVKGEDEQVRQSTIIVAAAHTPAAAASKPVAVAHIPAGAADPFDTFAPLYAQATRVPARSLRDELHPSQRTIVRPAVMRRGSLPPRWRYPQPAGE